MKLVLSGLCVSSGWMRPLTPSVHTNENRHESPTRTIKCILPLMIYNHRWLTRARLSQFVCFITPQHDVDLFETAAALWPVISYAPAGGRGRLGGRRGLEDAVHSERAAWDQRHRLPGAHGRGSGRFHFARGRTFAFEEHNGHEAVQPAFRHHVSQFVTWACPFYVHLCTSQDSSD